MAEEDELKPTMRQLMAQDDKTDLDRMVFEAIGRAFEDQTPKQIEREVDRAIREGRRRSRIGGSGRN